MTGAAVGKGICVHLLFYMYLLSLIQQHHDVSHILDITTNIASECDTEMMH